MSDVAIAPPPAAPASPAPAPAGEAVINQNPVGSPQPVGSQAPDRPVADQEQKNRPESRRESIQRAFDKARAAEADPKKPAPARPKQVDPNKAKLDAKAGEPELDLRKPARHREQGRFAKAPDAGADPALQQQGQPGAQQQGEPGAPQQPVRQAPPLPETAPYREPPPRMSDHARAEWAAAPESVRGEVYRMAQEFEGAYRKYRGDHDEMETIRPFHELATKHGTTLQRALHNYVGMEQKLRENPVAGLDQIVSNLNLRTSDGHKLTFRDVAYHVLSQSPEQLNQVQTKNAASAQSQQIGQLHQMVGTLAQTVQQMHYEKQFGQTRSAVDQFADSHPRFDELGDLIEQELRYGFSLEEAYQRADRLRPSSGNARAAQTRNPTAQTRSDKSISGAPDSGPSTGPSPRRKDDKPVGRREAIQNAIRRVNG